ncbi:MAG: tetratricopeptide repeat protein [Gemmataceae bacterium]
MVEQLMPVVDPGTTSDVTTSKQPSQPIVIAAADLERVLELYQEGQCLQAYRSAEQLGPLPAWRGAAARIVAGRLAINVGAPKLANWHHAKAWREHPTDPEACYYYARWVLERRGLLSAWKFLAEQGDLPHAPEPIRADWFAFRACVAGRLRDFDTAEAWLSRAEELAGDRPWICIERCSLFEFEDRYEEALAAARRALELRPWYRPGLQAVAHVLQLLDRDREALDLLTEAARHIENGLIVAQIAYIQSELEMYEQARQSYERYAELSPLLEKEVEEWLNGRRADMAYHCGDIPQAIDWAKKANNPFQTKVAENLAQDGSGQRVLLPVGFVRQHHQTCAPATLSAISRFWSMSVDHLEVVQEICYDGTPDHHERRWAEQNGWMAREFTLTWASAVALLDRGVPFTLTTVEPMSAHLQAVIGYDARRGTLLIRDPFERHSGEFLAEPMLERYRSTGPRGMVLTPQARADLLDGIELLDASLYDQLHQLQVALKEHDRDRAATAYNALRESAPDHRLTLQARRLLAMYDNNTTELLACLEQLLEKYPKDVNLQLSKVNCLRELARREERLVLLREICDKPDSDPFCWQQYAQELSADAREHVKTTRWLRRCIHCRPLNGWNYHYLANVWWDLRRFHDALPLYRFAACLEDKDERLARSYFSASRYLNQTGEALALLRNRFSRFGTRSSNPARTLFWAYSQLEDMTQAFAVLDEALRLRPDDGELLLYAADMHGNHGDYDRAAELLQAAAGRCQRTIWLRTAATLASYQGESARALELWRQIIEVEPLALDAHRAIAMLLAEASGDRSVAQAHLQEYCVRFPYNYALHQAWIEWLRDDGPAAAEPVIRHLLDIHPADAWARRELAWMLGQQGRLAEAFTEAETARGLDPHHPSLFNVLAMLYLRAGQRQAALAAYREGIRLSADNDFAIAGLISICDDWNERKEALAFVEGELVRQVIFGDGLLAFRSHASHTLDTAELLTSLRQALTARPDLWHAWSAVICQLTDMERLDEAWELAQQATARFPLLPRLWLDLALVCRARQDRSGEIDALQHALQINPGWGLAIRQLSEVYERDNELDQAHELLRQAVARSPLDPYNQGYLADIEWRLGHQDAALQRLQHTLRLDPSYEWAWRTLRIWAEERQQPELPRRFAHQRTEQRPGEARSWLMMAETLTQPEEQAERLAALERVLELNPRHIEVHDQKAELLAWQERYDEALAACQATVWDSRQPLLLRGRMAWIEAQRGNLDEAIARMRATVEEDPNYLWGWQNLAEWLREVGPDDAYREAAEHLVRLAPGNPVNYVHLGEAQERLGDRAATLENIQQAFALDPQYTYTGLRLFDMQMEDENIEAAGQTLAVLQEHDNDPYVMGRAARLAVTRENQSDAEEVLRTLCVSPCDSDWPLNQAARFMRQAGWGAQVGAILCQALESEAVHPQVASLWIEHLAAQQEWSSGAEWLDRLQPRGELGRRALITFLEELGKAHQRDWIQRTLRRHDQRLREDTYLWGTVGFALSTCNAHQQVIRWMADWPDRDGLQPWMLINLALSLHGAGKEEEAYRVSQRALQLTPDHTTRYHHLWLAAVEILRTDIASAKDRLAQAEYQECDASHRFLHVLVEAAISVACADPQERHAAFTLAREDLAMAAEECSPMLDDRLALTHIYRRIIRFLARATGGTGPLMWSLYRSVFPLLPKTE